MRRLFLPTVVLLSPAVFASCASIPQATYSSSTPVASEAATTRSVPAGGQVSIGQVVAGVVSGEQVAEYTVNLREGQRVYFTGTATSKGPEGLVALYNPTGNAELGVLQFSHRGEFFSRRAADILETGPHIIRVRSKSERFPDPVAYSWKMWEVNFAPEGVSPNISYDQIISEELPTGHHDEDNYTFNGKEGDVVFLDLQGLSGSYLSTARAEIYDPIGRRLNRVGTNGQQVKLEGNLRRSITLPSTGQYTVKVYGDGPYRLRVATK